MWIEGIGGVEAVCGETAGAGEGLKDTEKWKVRRKQVLTP
jgi:hypothetical protein